MENPKPVDYLGSPCKGLGVCVRTLATAEDVLSDRHDSKDERRATKEQDYDELIERAGKAWEAAEPKRHDCNDAGAEASDDPARQPSKPKAAEIRGQP